MPDPIELVGTDTVVNTFTTGQQLDPSITALADGGFVVSWSSAGQDGSANGVYAQRYDATGTQVGPNFQVNTFTIGAQGGATVVALQDGGFVVTWTSDNQLGSFSDIYAQRYDVAGNAVGGEFQVNTFATSGQLFANPTALSDGGFLVTWTSAGQLGGLGGIYAQRYNADGSANGTEFRVNAATSTGEISSVAALTDGGYVVTWEARNLASAGSLDDIYGQRFDANNNPVGGQFLVNTVVTSEQQRPSVTALASGGYVVTWGSLLEDGDSFGVYGQIYGADGQPVGANFQVNTFITSSQHLPSTTGLADGGFVVTWESFGQSGGFSIYAQRYDAAGVPVGAETLMSTGLGSQANPAAVTLLDGRLVVVWDQEIAFRIAELEGNDGAVVVWPTSDDIVTGTEARDVMRVGYTDANGDVIGQGDDSISGLAGNDRILAGAGNDTVDGGSDNDSVNGEDGFDLLSGGTGRDLLFGGDGGDSLDGGDGNDTLLGQDGLDLLEGGVGNDELSGGAGGDSQTGDAGNDFMSGGSGNDALVGGEGNDTLRGDAGKDTLTGGLDLDDDVLTGGSGADTFIFDYSQGTDTVTDFEQGKDRIEIAVLLPETEDIQAFIDQCGSLNEDGTEFTIDAGILFGGSETISMILRSSSPIVLATLADSFTVAEF